MNKIMKKIETNILNLNKPILSKRMFWLPALLSSLFAFSNVQAMHHQTEAGHDMQHHQHHHHHAMHKDSTSKNSADKSQALTRAEVKRIQLSSGKVTLKHDYIPAIDMPPMTMSFTASDPAMLKGLKKGDIVKFSTTEKLELTHIEKSE